MRTLKLLRLPAASLAFTIPMMLPSVIIALLNGGQDALRAFLIPAGIVVVISIPVILSFKYAPVKMRARDGFLTVSLAWVFISVLGALPYYIADTGMSFVDSLFESASSFATTGSTTLFDIEALSDSLLLWRSISYWVGGMGIVLLSVALVPLIGAGGFQLVKAETTGPDKDRITPKMTESAKVLWIFYFAFTACAFVLYMIGGMSPFDAVCHAFATLATGGVSIKNAGIGHYNSKFISTVFVVFMFLAALNFNLYYRLFKGRVKDLWYNSELRAYIVITAAVSLIVMHNIMPLYDNGLSAAHDAVFQTVAFISTSGTPVADYTLWPALSQGLLFMLMFIGGCSGSTAGGVKIIRYVVVFKQAVNEMRRLIYPRGVFTVRLNNKVGRKDVVYGVAAFLFLYMAVTAATALVTASAGFDITTSFSAALSVLGNLGTGFGLLSPGNNYSIFPDHIKIFYVFVMIMARLEIWTVLILFNREYWRA